MLRIFVLFFIIGQISTFAGLPKDAPVPPDFPNDFSTIDKELPAVDGKELASLKSSGFSDQLGKLRQHALLDNEWAKVGKKIGRDPPGISLVMHDVKTVKDPDSKFLLNHPEVIEEISEFSMDSNEIDENINDLNPTLPLRRSSKFERRDELEQIHNTDLMRDGLPPFAFSEDSSGPVISIDSDVKVPHATFVGMSRAVTTTTVRPTTIPVATTSMTTTRMTTTKTTTIPVTTPTPTSTTTTVRIPAFVTGTASRILETTVKPPQIFSATTRRFYQSSIKPKNLYTAQFLIEQPEKVTDPEPKPEIVYPTKESNLMKQVTIKRRSEGDGSLRERIRDTTRLLNLLGDQITDIDQATQAAPRTGVMTNIYDRGPRSKEARKLGYRHKQWGRTSSKREGRTRYDGQFYGQAIGETKQKGGGYFMRKKMGSGRYLVKRLRPQDRRYAFLQRNHEFVRSSRHIEEPNVAEEEKNFAEALLETEESSMRQLKKTLKQIRDVVKMKSLPPLATAPDINSTIVNISHSNQDSSSFKGSFETFRS